MLSAVAEQLAMHCHEEQQGLRPLLSYWAQFLDRLCRAQCCLGVLNAGFVVLLLASQDLVLLMQLRLHFYTALQKLDSAAGQYYVAQGRMKV